ncbi:Z-ring formation inhibitor MciZ [Robertmurraya massiliosenegalensis]|uniref:Z-ring formation inhibitor MciZ n=1 Tax=Robertmurraya massiliosenegalensis TaxID=1287657 RepID=UPI000302AB5B|nr:Z-ring formation inhibitor MciZ [Robertmurraya massiliosenegalensis]
MKVYVHEKGVILVGKGWEIRTKLKEYNQHYDRLQDWIQFIQKQESKKSDT